MQKDSSRVHRISALLKRELAALIQQEMNDPRVAKATLTDVDVAPDLSHAKIYVTHLDGVEHARGLIKALNHAAGFLRRRVAQRVDLRVVPDLRFLYDESVERGVNLSRLIDEARARDKGE
jgi:ribosome-binding factor A